MSAAVSVCAILVSYHPDLAALDTAFASVAPQVSALVVVDNASDVVIGETGNITVLRQPVNVGVAAAHNVGIEWARNAGHTHVLMLDQDSVPGLGMVAELVRAWRALSARGRVGAVGPRFRDSREARDAPFVRVGFPMSKKLWCDGSAPYIRTDFLISSGALISLEALDDIGTMDERLFIDNVDMEWSFRARALGYGLYGVCAATMSHLLGDERVPVFGGRAEIVRHSPVRLYYIMRNRVELYRRPHTPRVWVAQDLPRVVIKFLIFSGLIGPRRRNVRYMVRGLADGMRRRLGPCSIEARA